MPVVAFAALPDSARCWVFSAAAPVIGAAAETLLAQLDEQLTTWRAHGAPLVCGRDWRDDRFLAVAVDEAATGASGCSIDAMFHALAAMERDIGTTLVGNGRVYWRDAQGVVHVSDRPGFRTAAQRGDITADSPVFDTSITTVGAWRRDFEKSAAASWHARLLR